MTLQKIFNTITDHNATVETLNFGHKIEATIWIDEYTKIKASTYREALHSLMKEFQKSFVELIKAADFKKKYDNSFTVIVKTKNTFGDESYSTIVEIEMFEVR